MGRTKGSLNKKTLERMEFERRVRAEMEKERQLKEQVTAQLKNQDESEGEEEINLPPKLVVNPVVNNTRVMSRNNSRPVSSAKVNKFIPSVRTSSSPNFNSNSSGSLVKSQEDNMSNAEIKEEVKNEEVPTPKKRRGRPPKNHDTQENQESQTSVKTSVKTIESTMENSESEKNPKSETDTGTSTNTEAKNPESENSENSEKPKRGRGKQPDDEKYDHCSRCHTIIMCSPCQIDTNVLSGTSDCHRSCPRRTILCIDCSHELSNIIDQWLFNNGLGVEPKPWSDFGVKKMRQEEKEKSEEESKKESSD